MLVGADAKTLDLSIRLVGSKYQAIGAKVVGPFIEKFTN